MGRDTGSQGRSTDNSMEGWLDTEGPGPNLSLLCPMIGQTQGAAIGQGPAPAYDGGGSGQYDNQARRPDMASIRRGGGSMVTSRDDLFEISVFKV